ncbi:MAG TPA: ROK family protein [Solirubrobacteraceae bacterium]|nr:ROK family protein [Solirubrobacteraceae bacterium]
METGGSWCACALGRGPREILAVERFPTRGPEETIERIVAFFTGAGRPRPRALGVGAFGPVELDESSPHWGELLATTPKRGWAGTAIGSLLRDRLGVPLALESDVGAAALGERRWGAGRGAPSLCYVTVGTGIGAALLHGGRLLRGLLHPEAGHLRIPHDWERDPFAGSCPFHGDCWEGLASGSALRARWERSPESLDDAHEAWALEASYLAAGILAIVMIATPHRVVVGGGVMQRSGLLHRVRGELARLLAGYPDRPELAGDLAGYLVAPALGPRSGVLGALALAQARLAGAA